MEGRKGLESSTGVLNELVKREQALSGKVEAAKVEAAKFRFGRGRPPQRPGNITALGDFAQQNLLPR